MDDSRRLERIWPTGVGLMMALGGPPSLVAISRRVLGDSPTIGVQTLLQVVFCGLAVFVAFLVLRFEHVPLRSIGLRRPDWSTVVTALLLTFMGFVLLPLATGPLVKAFAQAGADAGVSRLAALPAWFRLFVGATSGIAEERLYRGSGSSRGRGARAVLSLAARLAGQRVGPHVGGLTNICGRRRLMEA